MTDRIPLDDLNSDDLDALYRRLDSLEKHLAMEEDASRQLLQQRQEMAGERFIWQERGDRAEADLRHEREQRDDLRRRLEATSNAYATTDTARLTAEAALDRVRAIRPYAKPFYGDRSQGYQMGWDAARAAVLAALEPPAVEEPTPLTVKMIAAWVPGCPAGRHAFHPGYTCADYETAQDVLTTAMGGMMGQLFAQAAEDHGPTPLFALPPGSRTDLSSPEWRPGDAQSRCPHRTITADMQYQCVFREGHSPHGHTGMSSNPGTPAAP